MVTATAPVCQAERGRERGPEDVVRGCCCGGLSPQAGSAPLGLQPDHRWGFCFLHEVPNHKKQRE